nr:hypothetical protein BaRGS_003393 [Batillaria attramentaria]
MAAFHRQGLKERINLCLFCLALMDLLALVSMVMTYGERLVTQFLPDMPHGGPLYRFTINHYLMGLIGCSWASQYLSAIIASERCLCIVSPLRAHDLLKTRTMLIIIVVGCLLIIAPMFVINTKISFACVYNPLTNSTSLQLHPTQFYLDNRQVLDAFDGLVYGPITLGLFLGVTIVATGITSFKLRSVAAWREKSASSSSKSNLEKKEVALTKMLVATSVVYILCHLPTLTFRISYFFVTDLSLTGRYFNAFLLMSRVLFLTGTVNSSINFIVYYAMGSRFRLTVKRMFRCHVTGDRRNGTSRGSSRTTVTETALGHDPKVTTISEN